MDGVLEDHASYDHADSCGERIEPFHRRLQLMGVGFSRLSEGIPVDNCSVDVPDEPRDGRTALVRDGGFRTRVDSDGACVPSMPEGDSSRNSPAEHEVNYG